MIKDLFNKKNVRIALFSIMIILATVSLIQGIRNASTDSQDFQWDAMKVFSMRINPYDESASVNPTGILDQFGYEEYYLQMEANQFPSLLMLLLPFGFLSPLAARYVWIVCNILFTAGILYLLKKTFLKDIDEYWFLVLSLLMIAGTPYRNQIGVGQHTLFAFFFFLLAVYFSEYRERRSIAVTILALFICYFKYTLTVPLVLYFIYKRRYLEIAVSAFMHVVLTFVGAWWLSDSFINMIIKPLKVASAISADGGLDISALFSGSAIAYVLAFLIMIILFIASIRLPEGFDCSLMAVLILWSLIITYHRTYDFFVLVAVSGMFTEIKKLALDKKIRIEENRISALLIYYIITMLAVFFVLRVFHENMPSKMAVGVLYYVLTFLVTYLIIGRGGYGKEK